MKYFFGLYTKDLINLKHFGATFRIVEDCPLWLRTCQGVTFLPLFATPSCFRSRTQAAYGTSAAFKRRQSSPISAVHSGSSWKMDNTFFAKAFLVSLH